MLTWEEADLPPFSDSHMSCYRLLSQDSKYSLNHKVLQEIKKDAGRCYLKASLRLDAIPGTWNH